MSHRVNDDSSSTWETTPPSGDGPEPTSRFSTSGSPASSYEDRSSRSSAYEDDPAPRFHKKKAKKKQPFWKELLVIFSVALLLTVVIQTFVARVFVIPSASMETTLHGCTGCVNDKVLVEKITYLFNDPRPGDVIVFRGPPNWTGGKQPPNFVVGTLQDLGSMVNLSEPSGTDFIKRVIAVGGQTVECCDEEGRVKVDGKPLDEPYLNFGGGPRQQDSFEKVTVPAGTLWVMGDNRNNSSDSRKHGDPTPADGAIPVSNVIGKARVIVIPVGRWGSISDHNPQTGGK
ncbi:signal peptidase I [Lentzea flaviverrucosa]|uniref:Signal peptidase I n=1 Tax=Lentzea flaviverrucosa TaxID=200379 RepID=A0A1H9M628_9PSEU|nr:signal peptidase I [Lentzea flaviverrucosa]RDI31065.1 signal peptidase I [Lentzea flaviverrucosa]SER18937.1 signal peptidase I [Lentzea flaviverrucosa]